MSKRSGSTTKVELVETHNLALSLKRLRMSKPSRLSPLDRAAIAWVRAVVGCGPHYIQRQAFIRLFNAAERRAAALKKGKP